MTSPKIPTLENILITRYRLKGFLITAIEPEKNNQRSASTLLFMLLSEVASGSVCHISS